MRTFLSSSLLLVITLAGGPRYVAAESADVQPAINRFEERRARRMEMEKAIQSASQEGAERYAAIASALRAAGYEIVPIESPFTWRLVAPASATPLPLLRIELYPLTTTPDAMKARFEGASVSTPQNFRLRFCFRTEGMPKDATPIRTEQNLPARILLEKLQAALLELPEIKTLAPKIPDAKTRRDRELVARIRTFQAMKAKADDWRAEYLREGDATPNDLRKRADLMERLSDTLEEAITDAQRERLGE